MTIPRGRLHGWKASDAAASAAAFEELLKRHNIRIEPGSPLEDSILEVHRLLEDRSSQSISPTQPDFRYRYRVLTGFQEFAATLLRIENRPGFAALIPHLKLLKTGSVLQSSRSLPRDQAANKLFELYMAALVLPYADAIELDDPFHSEGTNPDILAKMDGHVWGIACKVLHGRNPQGFCDRLLEGIQQVESSTAELGVVAFSIKNILPHDDLWPLTPISSNNPELTTSAHSSPEAAFAALYKFMMGVGQELVGRIGETLVQNIFHNKKVLPGFLLWGSSPMAAMINGRPCGVNPRTLFFQAFGPVEPQNREVLERWQHSLHNVGTRAV